MVAGPLGPGVGERTILPLLLLLTYLPAVMWLLPAPLVPGRTL
ncbi:hypothetical protein [Deinococcus hopiensis]|uniref:Uncharacterized protein n=1 Tax=Deinococcus hopiensis KR-140 TaxID=695939 RepID=A0A1W1V7N0_9DEIO|nr:hypothetical protein [Deinococcus hopiensis]SMB89362.1 hypothetical protein SAMN00790413_00382 [Deinococcus hopiensis KR-140]